MFIFNLSARSRIGLNIILMDDTRIYLFQILLFKYIIIQILFKTVDEYNSARVLVGCKPTNIIPSRDDVISI